MIAFIRWIVEELTEIRVPLVPWLRRTLWTDYDVSELDADERIIMQLGVINNPIDIAEFMKRYDSDTAADLLRKLPEKRWINRTRRIQRMRAVIFGGYERDPHAWEFNHVDETRSMFEE